MMRNGLEWITERARLDEVADDWDRLAAGRFRPFLDSSWFRCWWDAFGDGRSLEVCVLRRSGQMVGIFPLRRKGTTLSGLANDHSPVFAPVAADADALAALVAGVLKRCSVLKLEGLPASSEALAELHRGTDTSRKRVIAQPWHASPFTDTRGELANLRSARRQAWRETERRRRKLIREHDTEFRLMDHPRDVNVELAAGLEVEASGWKGRAKTAILSSPDTAGFYISLAAVLHSRGELRFSTVTCDRRLVAFDLALVHDRRYFLLKTAYDESYRSLSPGLVLRLAVIERCFEVGLEAHEFLGPDMAWKRLFATGTREHTALDAYSRRPIPTLRYEYRRQLRPWMRRAYRAAQSVYASER
jgi:CelD/BcsL family acetyltransferase involved in cellulose biosynthesis